MLLDSAEEFALEVIRFDENVKNSMLTKWVCTFFR